MKYSLFRSLLSLGTIILACSCSDDKSPSNGSEVSIVPCEDAWYLQEQGLLMYKDQKVTDLNGNQVGKLVPIQGTLIAIVKDMAGNTIVPQVDLGKTPVLTGDPTNTYFLFNARFVHSVGAPLAAPENKTRYRHAEHRCSDEKEARAERARFYARTEERLCVERF